jgi:hypothetical protein
VRNTLTEDCGPPRDVWMPRSLSSAAKLDEQRPQLLRALARCRSIALRQPRIAEPNAARLRLGERRLRARGDQRPLSLCARAA